MTDKRNPRDATECPRGHAYDEANTYVYRGRGFNERRCRKCRARNRRVVKAHVEPIDSKQLARCVDAIADDVLWEDLVGRFPHRVIEAALGGAKLSERRVSA